MKKIIALTIILSLSLGSISFAGNEKDAGNPVTKTSITGKIIDQKTSEELVGVAVQIEGTDLKAYTDIDGNFKIDGVKPGIYNLLLTYISYQDKKLSDVSIEPSASDKVEIKLEQIN